MKEILIISFYFPPELGAASNRISQLADGLNKNNFKVTVVTPLPNYPFGKIFNGYEKRFSKKAMENGIIVYRLWVYATKSKNKFLRLLAMISYNVSLFFFLLFKKTPGQVIVQSPPLLVAFCSLVLLKLKRKNIILNVSDLWPLAGLELGALKKGVSYSILRKIETFNYKTARVILCQSQEISDHIKSLFPKKETFIYQNFPTYTSLPEIIETEGSPPIKIVYAGLLGVAQGVLQLCENLDFSNVEFHIYGDGVEKNAIVDFIKENEHLPITYHGMLERDVLIKKLVQYDYAIIPLIKPIYGSVPSKIFEYATLGVPVIYFAGGEGEKIVQKHQTGMVVPPSDYVSLNYFFTTNKPVFTKEQRLHIRERALQSFDFQTQLADLIKKLSH